MANVATPEERLAVETAGYTYEVALRRLRPGTCGGPLRGTSCRPPSGESVPSVRCDLQERESAAGRTS
jgi:hypothetical protein